MNRRLLITFVVLYAALVATAEAGPIIDRAVTALRTDPIYVDPAARRALTAADVDRLRARIHALRAGPLLIAVLPDAAREEVGGSPRKALLEMGRAVRYPGTYALVIGEDFTALATSKVLPPRVAPQLAAKALAAHRSEGVAAMLLDFVNRVGVARKAERARLAAAKTPPRQEHNKYLIPIGLFLLGVGRYALTRRRRLAAEGRTGGARA